VASNVDIDTVIAIGMHTPADHGAQHEKDYVVALWEAYEQRRAGKERHDES